MGHHRGFLVGGDDHHLGERGELPDAPGGFDPVDPGEVDVHEHHVGTDPGHHLQGLLPRAHRPGDLHVLLSGQEHLQGLGEHAVVVDHQDANRGPHGLVSSTAESEKENVVSSPGLLSTHIRPPCDSTIRLAI